MKVVLLAGGFGTRLSELTNNIPKPMVRVGDVPIIMHIMEIYSKHGFNEFVIAAGYKADYIKSFFSNLHLVQSDYTLDVSTGQITLHKAPRLNFKITIIDTGLHTMTGGRLKRLKDVIGNERFMMTYGDGVSNVDISALIETHKAEKRLVTMTAVRPPARFGELAIDVNRVVSFEEKPQLHDGWINGGFFVMEPEVFDYLSGDHEMFEREPMQQLAINGELSAYKHEGFWQCMDSKKDFDKLNDMWDSGAAPWSTSL